MSSMHVHLNKAKLYAKQNHFELAKYSLISVTIFSSLVLIIELFIDRSDLYDLFNEELRSDPIAHSHSRLIVDTVVWVTVIIGTAYVSLYVWVVVTHKLVASLIMTFLNCLSFVWDLIEYEESITASVFHQICAVIEIILGLVFAFFLWKRRKVADREVRYVADQI